MRNTNKKGFTIVELVVVVAVIAILAAVMIPVFSGIIDKANLSADQKAVHDMNTALGMESNPDNIDAAIDALNKHEFNGDNLVPVSKDYSYVWSKTDYKIYLVKTNKITDDQFDLRDGIKYIDVAAKSASDIIAAISNGSEYIKLEADVTLASVLNIPTGKVTIDLNGKKLSAPSVTRPFNLSNGSEVVINAEGATIECGKYGIANFDSVSASLTINGGTFIGDLDNGAFIKVRAGGANTSVNVVLNNVNYNDSSDDSYIVNSKDYAGTLNVVVNGGSYKSQYGFNIDNATINGATINTEGFGVLVSGEGVVKNSTITTGNASDGMPAGCVAVQAGGSVEVNNCTLSSGNAALVTASSSGRIVAKENTITGETFQNNANSKHPSETKTVVYIEIDGVVEVDKTFE